MRYLLQKQSKEELIDTIVDLMEVKALLEYDVDLYRDWYKREQSQESYTRALLREAEAKRLKLYNSLRKIAESLGADPDEASDGQVIDEIVFEMGNVFVLDEGAKFTTEFTEEYLETGKNFIKLHEDGREEREALKAKLRGTYSYQDEKRRERFNKKGY